MKNTSKVSIARTMALAAISSLGMGMVQMASRSRNADMNRYYNMHKHSVAKPKNNPSGSKLMDSMSGGTLGMGRHTNSKHPIDGVTFSPKRDIGKGPRFTRSVRGITNGPANEYARSTRRAHTA